MVSNNLPSNYYLSGWSFNTDSEGIEVISNNCEIQDKSNNKKTNKECKGSYETKGNKSTFSYKFQMYNTEQLIITYKYKKNSKNKANTI